ncbi:hypothetical protein B7R54_13405 [Subtercola boreus]|uniref:NAD-dependent epimerase/dehydratase domain-containing protein n=1 Tax=Subtercola boreus TaxID=120213 RepID=A0A3E0VJI0_9MICO|nr:NAD-dependent epimerase/dehydratase family protein [Subtercola boreus]RFA10096.1 hypothetical protein B7R54_13405 [Subtercola boreus]TQL52751.1 UDP-glucose 4-epimerase [Subtercola boreus]
MLAWVVGAHGLLGQAVLREVARRPQWTLFAAESLPWSDTPAIVPTVARLARRFGEAVSGADSEWAFIWVAGAGVVASGEEGLALEASVFESALATVLAAVEAEGMGHRGVVFLASSAGGVYAGSEGPPFTEQSVPAPLAAYGRAKLRMEAWLEESAATAGVSTVVGRIANLYGPGQKLSKPQGLISHLALAQLSPRPASIFVPLDTVRDYLFVDDCALLVCDSLERARREAIATGEPVHGTKILASGAGTSVAALLGSFRQLARRRPHVALGSSPQASLQPLDLRLSSTFWPELDRRQLTPLCVGIRATLLDMSARKQLSTTATE